MAKPVQVLSLDAFGAFSACLGEALTQLAESAAATDSVTASRLDWVRGQVVAAESALEEAQERCIEAERDLLSADAELSAAESALSACETAESDDARSDCSCEAHAVEMAEQKLEEAQQALIQAQETRQLAIERAERARSWDTRLGTEFTRVREQCLGAVATVSGQWEAARQEIAKRVSLLQEYVSEEQPPAEARAPNAIQRDTAGGSVADWLSGNGFRDRAWRPEDFVSRFRLSAPELQVFTRHLASANAAFRGEIARRRDEWTKCQGAADRERVFVQVKRTTAGLWSEHFVREALAPLAPSVTAQRRTTTLDGDTTVTDLVLREVTHSVVLGRGEGRFVPAGGSLAVEVKARRPHGLLAEADHLASQVSGHREESASLVIVTRDIHELETDRAGELRGLVRGAGSAVWALLPRKEEIDQLCWDLVRMPEDSP